MLKGRVKGLKRGGWGKGGEQAWRVGTSTAKWVARVWTVGVKSGKKDCADLFGSGFHVYAEKLLVVTMYENWRVGNLEREGDGSVRTQRRASLSQQLSLEVFGSNQDRKHCRKHMADQTDCQVEGRLRGWEKSADGQCNEWWK